MPESVIFMLGMAALLAPPASAAPADAGMPTLRTGERKLVDQAEPAAVEVARHHVDATDELMVLKVAAPEGLDRADHIDLRSSGGAPAFVVVHDDRLWVRRSAREAGRGLEGELYLPPSGWRSPEPARRIRFKVPAQERWSDPSLRKELGEACASELSEWRRGALFYGFAGERLRNHFAPQPSNPKERARTMPRPDRGTELERLMDTTTGMASIQEAIQADRPLWLQTAREKATVPLASLKGPPLASHPFAEMLRALRRPVPEEKLAAATPAEFYYVRLNDLTVFFRIVDQLDAWATPALNVLEGRGEEHALSERTLTQLGLERTQLARTLGPSVVADLALVGSDPYVREGSDVTVIFRMKQKALFDVALGNSLANHLRAHPGEPETRVDHQGTAIRVQRSSDGALRQHRASAGDLEIVSNSLAATRRVLDAIAGRAPRLSDQPDLQYMLARGAGEAAPRGTASPSGRNEGQRTDGFVFLGDRFVAEVVGPRQKILQARRQLALSELLVPGYAALLFGWLEGRAPASSDELITAGWLGKDELRHALDGAGISFVPGRGARSSWGSPAVLEPLIELATPKLVSASEKSAYERFADGYQRYWQQFMDPVAIRIGVEPDGKAGTRLTVDVRVLPLIEGTSYRDIAETVGHARVATPAIAAGARGVIGIGADARLRREVSRLASSSPLGDRIALDWLGDWIFWGVEDRAEVARTVLALEPHGVPQAPAASERDHKDEFATALKTPVYLAIGLNNLVGATLFLTAARKLVSDAAPGLVTWGEGPLYKGTHTVHIAIAPKSISNGAPGADLWYAIADSALVLALSESVLHRVLDERAGGKGTRSVDKDGAPQLVVEWASERGQPLNRLLGWLLEAAGLESMPRSRARAEVLLRGAPGASLREIGLAYEGSEPVPADGGHYTLAPDGVRDPARGSAVLEKWPALPVPGSPVERLLGAVARFRGEVGFDDEPKLEGKPAMRSLHARVTLGLRP
jgi:hypothetical protein